MKRTVRVEVRSNERVLVLDDEELDALIDKVGLTPTGGPLGRLRRKVDDIR